MKLATDRPTTQSARIYALEQARATDNDRLEKIEKTVSEIRELLLGAKAIIWFVGKIVAWVGGPSAIAGAGYAVWRVLH
ncbi:hypothetical protein [Bradyrhizobium roseum]|uniref:hypothetical protein n=1 Tax=Bradyrhizobium roseum TaxID=3056648 RepID=UPI00262A2C9A|nr:hypothetical protein [Bradyrhizobium roseus]WKA31617.1 hypothetical protein QUH67_16285 [Bradyrhizobium roseus]